MTIFRLTFAGEIKKADTKSVGGKSLVELSICKKNRTKDGDPESYTWLRIGLWEPAQFQIPKLVKGSFIAGSGELTLRSYEGKDGKATSLECRCSSFDVEVSDGSAKSGPIEHHAAKPYDSQQNRSEPHRIPLPAAGADGDIPFARPLTADFWG
jgi:single-stranded DNA-binding protein